MPFHGRLSGTTAMSTTENTPESEAVKAPPQIRMRRPSLDELPPLDVPLGLTLRTAESQDEPALAALLASAFEDDSWTVERVQKSLTQADDVYQVFVLVGESGDLMATASSQFRPGDTRSGFVHWVGANPTIKVKGQRLGYRVSLAVLHDLKARGFSSSTLITDDFRLPAIKTYLNLGFLPLVTHESHPERWQKVAAGLGIPPLGLLYETAV
jgi:mycothiol synthase